MKFLLASHEQRHAREQHEHGRRTATIAAVAIDHSSMRV